MNKDFSRSFLASKQLKKPSLNKSSQPYVSRSRPYSQASSIKGGGSVSSNDSVNLDLMLNNGEIFPEDILILLGEEQRNIVSFKDRIEREKMKIENDFSNFKRQMEHVMEDLKISMQAELDKVYRFFIEKYATLKSEVQEIKKIKKEIETQQISDSVYEKNIPMNSNKELIKELTKDSKNYRLYKIQNYIVELQKKRVNPLLEVAKQLILLQTTNRNYYESDAVTHQLAALKQQIGHFTSHMFGSLGKYIVNPLMGFQHNLAEQMSILSDKREQQMEYLPLKELQHKDYVPREPYAPKDFQRDRRDGRDMRDPRANSKQSRDPRAPRDPRDYLDQNNFIRPDIPPLITKSVYTSPHIQKFQPRQFEPGYVPPRAITQPFQYSNHSSLPSVSQPKRFKVSQSQQIISFPWVEDLRLYSQSSTIYPQHSTILCALVINNTFVVTGGKDSLIYVFTLDGMKIATLKAHTASVCALATINNTDGKTTMLVSGSDVGCSTLIFWDVSSWTIRSKIQAHSAAITSIVDLKDGQTLVSGSYDKLINIYNHRRAEVSYNLSANKCHVTAIVLSADGSRMTSCGLDKSLYVWKIARRQGIVESIELERIIQNDVMICSLNSLTLRTEIIVTGTKDGRIKFWNLNNGECQKTLTANNSAIIELVVVQRESKPNHPLILSCSSKDRSLVLTNTQNLINSLFEVNDKLNIELGCGIGHKIIFGKMKGAPVVLLVSQSPERKEVNIFEIQAK